MTVASLRAEMTNQEFVEWRAYLGRRAQREELDMAKSKARGR